jgi:flagellar protein FlgJ
MGVPQIGLVDPAQRQTRGAGSARDGTERQAATAFEALVLRQAIEIMLPKTGQGLLGGGFAGETWRSMLADRLAEALAQQGGVGIAQAVSPTLAAVSAGSGQAVVPAGAGADP